MKRLLAVMFFLCGLACFAPNVALALPTAAQCPATNQNTDYPTDGHIYDCQSYDPSDFQQIYLAMVKLASHSIGFFQTATNSGYGTGIPIYFVKNNQEFATLFPGFAQNPGDCSESSKSAPFFVVVLDYCVGVSTPQTSLSMVIEIDHELGHIWNDNHPFTTQLKTGGKTVFPDATTAALSGANSFDYLTQHDFFNLDWEDSAGTIRRPPCGANGSEGPFSTEDDLLHNANICNGNTPLAPYDGSVAVTDPHNPTGAKIKLTTNGLILQYMLPYWFIKSTNTEDVPAWDELYPEEFGLTESGFTGGSIIQADLFIQDWFGCSTAWPSIAVQGNGSGGTLPPPNQGNCQITLPASAKVYN